MTHFLRLVDDFAEEFHTTPGRLKTTLQKVADAGLTKIEGDISQQVVPTVKLLRHKDPHLSAEKAEKLIRQYRRGTYR